MTVTILPRLSFLRLFFLSSLLMLLFSCASQTPVVMEPVEERVEKEAPPEEKPAEVLEDEPGIAEEKEPEDDPAPEEYVMSEEDYQETKRNLSELVQELNKIVSSKDYETWLSYLTKEYRDYYSRTSVLKEQSESPLLKKYDVVLRSLRDYFLYVVVGSRQNVRLDEIKAMEEGRVRAYMYINGDPVIIYELQKVDEVWKIGVIN